MSKEILKIVLNDKVYFEIIVKTIASEVSEGQLDNFISKLSEKVLDILSNEYTDGMELIH